MAQRQADPLRGILLIVFAIFLFVVMDATAKYLSAFLPVLQIVWARNVFALVFALAILRRRNPLAMLRSNRPGLQLVRSFLLFASTWFFFAAIQAIPLADASSISFVAPLLVTALSVPLLGERVGPRRWAAVVVGFLGAMIIIRPGTGTLQLASLLPLGSATCFALYQIATRVLAASDHALTTTLYSPIVGAMATSALMPLLWIQPEPAQWGLLLLVGLIGGFSHFVLIKAYEYAPPSILAPFAYTNLVWSVSLGYLLFADLPDRWTALGAAIVVASGLYTFYREGVRRRQAARGEG
jgi:drug/metabolite transporter (DMT)-like permease